MPNITMPNGDIVAFPDDMPNEQIRALIASKFPEVVQPKTRAAMDFGERMAANYARRIGKMEQAADAYVSGQQSMGETVAQQGLQYAQLAPDVATEIMVSGFRALPDPIETLIRETAGDVYSGVKNTTIGRLVGGAVGDVASAYTDFAQENPRAARNLGAVGNLGNLALAFVPIKGASPVARVGEAGTKAATLTGKATMAAGKKAAQPLIKSGAWAATKLDEVTDTLAQGVSQAVSRANVPKPLRSLDNAELLFVKTLADEGVSFDDALQSLKLAKQYKASPSVAVTADIPQMQTQGFLMSGGSSGSRVASKAIDDINTVQIPMLNKKLIEQATGGKYLPAEQFGRVVSQEAKRLVDAKKAQLRTRAKPHYARSVGVDKMVPIENPQMKSALNNKLVVKALDDFRADPVTITSVADELADLGVAAGDIAQLPYNNTVSLHAARVALRRQSDKAFREGDGVAMRALKNAMNNIDEAIESAYPSYKRARSIYSEDAGALKTLMDSPVGKMSTFAEGNFSKIANDLATKDAPYIRKFMAGLGDNQKMRDAIAGAYINRIREESRNVGRKFSDVLFGRGTEGGAERLMALVGQDRFNQMQKVSNVIDDLVKTGDMRVGSKTSLAESVKSGLGVPVDRAGAISWIKNKISPDLFTVVQRDPRAAARYNELLFTDEGFRFLNKISGQTKALKPGDVDEIVKFLNKNAQIAVGGK